MGDYFTHIIAQLRIEETKIDSLREELSAMQKRFFDEQAKVQGLQAARVAYASEFPLNEEGEPDVGNIHANIRALKAKVQELSATKHNCLQCGTSTSPCIHEEKGLSPDISKIALSNRIYELTVDLSSARNKNYELKEFIGKAPHERMCPAIVQSYLDAAYNWYHIDRIPPKPELCNCWKKDVPL